jgi:hypothetical protein
MVDLARRNNFPWDAILGAETAGDYKPKPRVYLAACVALDLPPGECMMVAAHTNDLLAAAACGLRTAHIARPNERGPGTGEAAPKAPVDVAAAAWRIWPPGSMHEVAAVVVTASASLKSWPGEVRSIFPPCWPSRSSRIPAGRWAGWSAACRSASSSPGSSRREWAPSSSAKAAGRCSPRARCFTLPARRHRLAPTLPLYLRLGSCSAPAWERVSTTRCSPRSASSTARRRAHPSPISRCSAGFASTVCWPLSAFLAETVGWRGACLVYAGLHLCVSLPAPDGGHAAIVALPKADAVAGVAADKPQGPRMPLQQYLTFALLALVLTISAGIGSIVVVHLLIFLQAKGTTFAEAVTLGHAVRSRPGRCSLRRAHLRRTLSSDLDHGRIVRLMAAGLALLLAAFPILAVAIVIYAAVTASCGSRAARCRSRCSVRRAMPP